MFGCGKKLPALRRPRVYTGVGATFTATHRPPYCSGPAHEHTWTIIAWHLDEGCDALKAQSWLNAIVARLEGTCLPDAIGRNETLAAYIAAQIDVERSRSNPYDEATCVQVDVSRDHERLYARWFA